MVVFFCFFCVYVLLVTVFSMKTHAAINSFKRECKIFYLYDQNFLLNES